MGILSLALVAMVFALVAKRLESSFLTAPMLFLGFGVLLTFIAGKPDATAERALHIIAEVTLVVVLFLDAAQTDLKALRQRHVWPLRMLVIALPLAIAFGFVANALFLPGWPLIALALLAAIMAPTDAALGQAVVMNKDVPIRVRRALTVESGLNDGLALPIILLFASLAADSMGSSTTNWFLFTGQQLILGPLAGIVMGAIGGHTLMWAKKNKTTSETYEGIGALALAAAAYQSAILIGGNGFISVFVAGLVFGYIVEGRCKFVYEFTESEGQLLTWGTFLLLGFALVPAAFTHLTWPIFGLILFSLFIVRPLAVWISLIGTDAKPATRLFFGWFGPRGLATALFALLVLPQIEHQLAEEVLYIAINTVWISALLHGVTAAFGARWYGRYIAKFETCSELQNSPQLAPSIDRGIP